MKTRNLAGFTTAALLTLVLAGCNTLPLCPTIECMPCPDVPCCSRGRVWVFLISGIDPCCQMDVLRERLIAGGFIKIYSGGLLHGKHFISEIQKRHREDEEARFVIVSQGCANGVAREVAEKAGWPIDLIVFLDDTGKGPAPARRVIFIHDKGDKAEDAAVAEESVCLSDPVHFGAAAHPETARTIARELCEVARDIAVIPEGPPCCLAGNVSCPGWEFLRPDGKDSGYIHSMPFDDANVQIPVEEKDPGKQTPAAEKTSPAPQNAEKSAKPTPGKFTLPPFPKL